MTTNSEPAPARRPEDLGTFFLERANAGDVEGLVALYEPEAVLAVSPERLAPRSRWPGASRTEAGGG
jgi:hypothetical protein